MVYVQNPQEPTPRPWWRWFVFPVLTVAFFGAILMIPRIWIALGYDVNEDQTFLALTLTQLAGPCGILVLGIWWLGFSGVRWSVRLGLPALLIGALGAISYYTVRNVEISTTERGMLTTFYFVWERSAEEDLEHHLQQVAAKKAELPPIDATAGADDFPRYRGATYDGVVPHLQLQTNWTKSPPVELWRQPCPGGYSGVAVAGNIAVTQEKRGDKELVVCYDRATGRQRWEFAYGAYRKDKFGDGPRATPTIHQNRIFALGAGGDLVCLEVTGEKVWSINILTECSAKNIEWGLSGSPLIVDDLVVVNAGVDKANNAGMALAAFDQKTGTKKWALSHHPAGYSSPQLATLGGVRQILMFHGDALVGHDPKTGVELWTIPWETHQDMNSIQPVVIGGERVFISSETGNGCGLFRISQSASKKWEVEPVWKNKNVGTRFANPVTDGTHLFCLHGVPGVLTCLNVSDGTLKWRGPRQAPGQLLLIGSILLVTNGDNGDISLFATNTTECQELAQYSTFGRKTWEKDNKTWNTPTLAGDQLFVRNQYEMVCLKLAKR